MNQNGWIKYFDYLYITRPMLFFPGWNTLIAGYLVARGEVQVHRLILSGEFSWNLWVGDLVFMTLIFATAIGGSFILNQLQDVESDRKNSKLFLICKNYVSSKAAFTESILLIAASLVLSFLANRQAFYLIALGTISGYFYNYPPFQYKNRPLPGLLLNALVGWIAFGLGWVLVLGLNTGFLLRSLPYLFLNTGLYLLTTIPDAAGDRQAKKITFCVRYGADATIWVAVGFYLLSLLSAIFLYDAFIFIINILTFFWIVQLIRKRNSSAVLKVVKMAIFFFSVAICFKFPLYFLLMVFLFYLTRFYYRKRFRFDYPNFRGE